MPLPIQRLACLLDDDDDCNSLASGSDDSLDAEELDGVEYDGCYELDEDLHGGKNTNTHIISTGHSYSSSLDGDEEPYRHHTPHQSWALIHQPTASQDCQGYMGFKGTHPSPWSHPLQSWALIQLTASQDCQEYLGFKGTHPSPWSHPLHPHTSHHLLTHPGHQHW